jgi:hypothetical protein
MIGYSHAVRRIAIPTLALLVAGACDEENVTTGPVHEATTLSVQRIRCEASISAETVLCRGPRASTTSGGPLFLIVGGQGEYVQLTSTNVHYDGGAEVFYADVTVQNLMNRPLGTPDGSTVTGVRVFFHSGPSVTNGSGTVTVRNHDGTGSFTGTNQPYHEYWEMLDTGETTSPKTWEWDVPSSVLEFVFEVYVEADRDLAGWWIGSREDAGGHLPGLGWTLTVDAAGTRLTEITHFLGGTDHLLGGVEFWCGTDYTGFAKRNNGGAGWPIILDEFETGPVRLAGGVGYWYVLDMELEGEFQSAQFVTGSWQAISSIVTNVPPTMFCSGSWSGEPATRLFLRYDGSVPFLSVEPSPPDESWLASFSDGQTVTWWAELDDPLAGDLYTFELPLRASSGEGGDFDLMWKIYHEGAPTRLAEATIRVPRSDAFDYYREMVWWTAQGGSVGDELVFEISYRGSAPGELLFGYGHESFTVVPSRVSVSMPTSPTAVIALGGATVQPSPHGAGMSIEPPQK